MKVFTKNELKKIVISDFPDVYFEDSNDEFPYVDASDFLMGSCELFALALHHIFQYDVYEIYDDKGAMVHCFCIVCNDNAGFFVDVRGFNTDFYEFIEGIPVRKGCSIRLRNIREDEKLQDKWDQVGYDFATAIIRCNYDAYCMPNPQ